MSLERINYERLVHPRSAADAPSASGTSMRCLHGVAGIGRTQPRLEAGIKAAQPEAEQTLKMKLCILVEFLSLGFKQKQRVMLTRQTQHFKNMLRKN